MNDFDMRLRRLLSGRSVEGLPVMTNAALHRIVTTQMLATITALLDRGVDDPTPLSLAYWQLCLAMQRVTGGRMTPQEVTAALGPVLAKSDVPSQGHVSRNTDPNSRPFFFGPDDDRTVKFRG
jgi:hypothetical protein